MLPFITTVLVNINVAIILQAESVTHHLSAPVLRHSSLKPSYSCIKNIRAYFSSLPRPVRDDELIIVGDRLLTDMVMANRMTRRRPQVPRQDATDEKAALVEESGCADVIYSERVGPLGVWTEGLWKREALALRALERGMLAGVERWLLKPQDSAWRESLQHRFVRPLPVPPVPEVQEGWVRRVWRTFRS